MDMFDAVACVITGGTREPIDKVRCITNDSTGRFGLAIGKALKRRGHAPRVLASTGIESGRIKKACKRWLRKQDLVRFTSYADLKARLLAELHFVVNKGLVPIVFMAAAVSDFSPIPAEGKISSDQDELVIKARRNPKLLASFRRYCGPDAFLVGFKLVSEVSREAMLAKARKQLEECRLDLVVANDKSMLTDGRHPVTLVTPEGGAIDLDGTRQQVARQLVDFVLRRAAARRLPTAEMSEGRILAKADPSASAALRVASVTGLLSKGGTVSTRGADGSVWVTSARAEAAGPGGSEAGLIQTRLSDDGTFLVPSAGGPHSPAAEAPMHALLYLEMPDVRTLIRVPEALMLEQANTVFPYPAGSREDAAEILAALSKAAMGKRDDQRGFGLRLVHRGCLLGFRYADEISRFALNWDEARAAYLIHLRESGHEALLDEMAIRPILNGNDAIGVEAVHREGGWTSIFLIRHFQGRGYGERLVARLTDDKRRIGVRGGGRAEAFFIAHGYRHVEDQLGMRIMEPPSVRTDLREAATICLFNPTTRKVLIGTRKTEPWLDYHCCPGGSREDGDADLLATAKRECLEEAGVDAGGLSPIESSEWFTATGEGGQNGYRVTNFMVPIFREPPPVETRELRSRWMRVDEAVKLAPAGYATRAVLRALDAKLPR